MRGGKDTHRHTSRLIMCDAVTNAGWPRRQEVSGRLAIDCGHAKQLGALSAKSPAVQPDRWLMVCNTSM